MIEPWMGVAILCLTPYAFGLGFAAGTQYVTEIATPKRSEWRPEWLQAAVDAYNQSFRRPLSAEEVAACEWGDTDPDATN